MTAHRLQPLLPTAALASLTGFGLVRFAPAAGQLRTGLFRPHAWIEEAGPDAALASFTGALLWIAALWLAIGLLAAMLSRLPGRPGRVAGAFTRRALPTALRSVVLASTGASLLISPVAAIAADPAASGPPSTAASTPFWPLDQPDRPLPAPGWPTSSQLPASTGMTANSTPATAPVTHPTPPRGSSTPSRAAGPTAATPTPPTSRQVSVEPTTPAPPSAKIPPASAESMTVRPGDSLWKIAAHRLGAAARASQIEIEWPYWYRANRKVIGSDPNLLRPGTELVVPDQSMDSAR
jgi:hypothetical protein